MMKMRTKKNAWGVSGTSDQFVVRIGSKAAMILLMMACIASWRIGAGREQGTTRGGGLIFAAATSSTDGEVLAYPAKVTCGSVVKIVNKNTMLHLRSQEIAYGSGSGQQAVTALETAEEAFNFWVRPFRLLDDASCRFHARPLGRIERGFPRSNDDVRTAASC